VCVLTGGMGWLRLVGSLKLQVSFAKELYKRDDVLQKRPMIFKEPTDRSHNIVKGVCVRIGGTVKYVWRVYWEGCVLIGR